MAADGLVTVQTESIQQKRLKNYIEQSNNRHTVLRCKNNHVLLSSGTVDHLLLSFCFCSVFNCSIVTLSWQAQNLDFFIASDGSRSL